MMTILYKYIQRHFVPGVENEGKWTSRRSFPRKWKVRREQSVVRQIGLLIFLFLLPYLSWKEFFFWYYLQYQKIYFLSFLIENTKSHLITQIVRSINIHPRTLQFLLFYMLFIFPDILQANKICSNAGRMPPTYNHWYSCHSQGFYCCLAATPRQQLSKLCCCKKHHFLSLKRGYRP